MAGLAPEPEPESRARGLAADKAVPGSPVVAGGVELGEAGWGGLGREGVLTSSLHHHMVVQQTQTGERPPTVLRGTAPPFAMLSLAGYQYSGQTSPLPGSPFITKADNAGHWQLTLSVAEGPQLSVAGPCTLRLTVTARGAEASGARAVAEVAALGCWVGDVAEHSQYVRDHGVPCDYGAPSDHLYCPPPLRQASALQLRTGACHAQYLLTHVRCLSCSDPRHWVQRRSIWR